VILTREQEIQLLASTFIRSLKQHGHCIDAKSVYTRMGQYDISKKRIYAVRQHVIRSVSARLLNSSPSKLVNDINEKKIAPSKFSQQQQPSQKIPRELRQLGVLSEELPPKRNGRT
jgi:hypothetical protein